MPIIIKDISKLDVCSVSDAGIGMTNGIVREAGWKIGDTIQVGFIEKAKCILLCKSPKDEGFKLAYANTRKKTGGKIYCIAFIRNYLQTLVALPKKRIPAVFLSNTEWTFALLLEAIDWTTGDFTKAEVNTIDKEAVGTYEILGKGDAVLRIGEGKIYDRLNAHLKDQRFAPPTVKKFRYINLEDLIDGQLLEKILIKRFEDEAGTLPRFQQIHA